MEMSDPTSFIGVQGHFSDSGSGGDGDNQEELEESDDDEHPSDNSNVFVLGTGLPIYHDPGKCVYDQGVRQREQVRKVAENVEREMLAQGLDQLDCSDMLRGWLTVICGLARVLCDMLRIEYRRLSREPLTDGVMIQYFLVLKLLNHYSITPAEYYAYEDNPKTRPYLRVRDTLNRDRFMIIWRLLDAPDKVDKNRLFPKVFAVNRKFRTIQKQFMDHMFKFVMGSSHLDASMYDLMMIATNKAGMTEDGVWTGWNARKKSKTDASADVITAVSPLNIVVGCFLAYDNPKKKDTDIVHAFLNLTQEGSSQVHVTLDKGYDRLSFSLMAAGVDVTSISQQGRGQQSQVPFSMGPAYSQNANGTVTIPAVALHDITMAHWRKSENTGHRPVLHGAFEYSIGKPALLLKTTDMDLENAFTVLPEKASGRIELGRKYFASLNAPVGESSNSSGLSSTTTIPTTVPAPQPVEVNLAVPSGTVSSDSAPISSSEALDSESNFIAYLDHLLLSKCRLSGSQNTTLSLLVRRAISSTVAKTIVLWWRKAASRSLFLSGERSSLVDLALDLVPTEISQEQSQLPLEYSETFEAHMDFLCGLTRVDPPGIPSEFIPLAWGGLETAPREVILAVGKAFKKVQYDGRVRQQPQISDEAYAKLKMDLQSLIDGKFGKDGCNLAADIFHNWSANLKDDDLSAKDLQAEQDYIKILPRELPGISFLHKRFVSSSSNQPNTVESTVVPFSKVSPVRTVGCIATHITSPCLASVGGIFCARAADGDPIEPWVLQVKTKTSLTTIGHAMTGGPHRVFDIEEATCDFEFTQLAKSLSDADFGLEALHHAAISNIPNVLFAILDYERGKVIRFVAIKFAPILLDRHRRAIEYIADRFLPFLTRATSLSWGGLDAARLNFFREYRQGALRVQIDQKALEEQYVNPVITYIYDCAKSRVDILHKPMASIPDSDLSTSGQFFLALINCAIVSADQCARAFMVKDKLDSVCSAEDLSRLLSDEASQSALTFGVVSGFQLDLDPRFASPKVKNEAVQYDVDVPAVPEVYSIFRPQDPDWFAKVISKRDSITCHNDAEAATAARKLLKSTRKTGNFHIAEAFFSDPDLCSLRLGTSEEKPVVRHVGRTSIPNGESTRVRRRCVLCCFACENGSGKRGHNRHGFQTWNRCLACQVFLCTTERGLWGNQSCFERWHTLRSHIGSHPFPTPASKPATTTTTTTTAAQNTVAIDNSTSSMRHSVPSLPGTAAPAPRVKVASQEGKSSKAHQTPPNVQQTRAKPALLNDDSSEAAASALISLGDNSQRHPPENSKRRKIRRQVKG